MKKARSLFLLSFCMAAGSVAFAGENQDRQRELQQYINRCVQQWTHQYNEVHTNPKPSDPAWQQKVENVQKLEREIQQERRDLDRIRR